MKNGIGQVDHRFVLAHDFLASECGDIQSATHFPSSPNNAGFLGSGSASCAAEKQILKAYANVRIGAQKRYCEHLVSSLGPFRTHPGAQKLILSRIGATIVVGILLLHLSVVAGVLSSHAGLKSRAVHILAVSLALIALGFRAVEDGLRPKEHFGRLIGYLAEVTSIEESFNIERGGHRELDLMVALEKAAYKEMLDFLQNADKARYVM